MRTVLLVLSLSICVFLRLPLPGAVQIVNCGDNIEESKTKLMEMNRNRPMGLFLTNGRIQALPVRLLFNDSRNEAFATLVITTDRGKALFVVAGLNIRRMRTLDFTPAMKLHFLDPAAKPLSIVFAGKKYLISRQPAIPRQDDEPGDTCYDYLIETNAGGRRIRHLLPRLRLDCTLVWLGDLDGDGELDLAVDFSPGAGGGSLRALFLSSLRGPGEIVRLADTTVNWSLN